jgi:hypothetical protein
MAWELIGKTMSYLKDELVVLGIDFDNSTQDFYVVYALRLSHNSLAKNLAKP